jgi:hypothetical protein
MPKLRSVATFPEVKTKEARGRIEHVKESDDEAERNRRWGGSRRGGCGGLVQGRLDEVWMERH